MCKGAAPHSGGASDAAHDDRKRRKHPSYPHGRLVAKIMLALLCAHAPSCRSAAPSKSRSTWTPLFPGSLLAACCGWKLRGILVGGKAAVRAARSRSAVHTPCPEAAEGA